jgi:hypothetical protein
LSKPADRSLSELSASLDQAGAEAILVSDGHEERSASGQADDVRGLLNIG